MAGAFAALAVVLMTACQLDAQWKDYGYYQVQKTERMREAVLANGMERMQSEDGKGKESGRETAGQQSSDGSRDMVVTVDMQFLKTDNKATAKACGIINAQLKELLLHQAGELTDEEAVAQYIEDVKAEFRGNETMETYSEELTGRVEYGTDRIINYRLVENSYAGGAHPCSVTTILRFDAQTGEFITLDNVFPLDRQERLRELLLARLMQNLKVNSLEELHDKGYLEWMEMFASTNFALRVDSIEFFYNEYDIAPYAVGTSTICLSYEEARILMGVDENSGKQ